MNKLKIYLIIGSFLTFLFLSQLQDMAKIDEYYNHFPTVITIFNNNFFEIITSENYKAANTPLPYLLSVLPYKILGTLPTLRGLRLINSLVALITLLVICFYLKSENLNKEFYTIGLIFFYPYFLKPAFTYYMAIYGLLFSIISLYLLSRHKPSSGNWLLIGIFISLAVLSQQFYLMLIPAFLLYLKFSPDKIKIKVRYGILFILPILILVSPIFLMWNGLTHPNYSFHSTNIDFTKITAILLVIGVTFFFYFLSLLKYFNKKLFILSLFLSLILNLFLYPDFSIKGGFERITGYTFHFIHLATKFNFFIGFLTRYIAVTIGIYVIYDLFKKMIINKSNYNDIIFFLILSMMMLGFIFNTLLAERHLLPIIVFLVIYSIKTISSKLLVKIWLGVHMFIGTLYYLYYLFFQPSYQIIFPK